MSNPINHPGGRHFDGRDNQPQVGTCSQRWVPPHAKTDACCNWKPVPQPTPAEPRIETEPVKQFVAKEAGAQPEERARFEKWYQKEFGGEPQTPGCKAMARFGWMARAGSSLSLDEKAALLEAKSHSDNFHGVPFDDGFHCGWKARMMPPDWGKWENLLTAGERFLEHANSKTDWRNRKFALRKAVQELRASSTSSSGADPTLTEQDLRIMAANDRVAEHKRLDHETVPIKVWADIDVGIVELVKSLNLLPGVRTQASCQGESSGPAPYGPYVMATWPAEMEDVLAAHYEIELLGENWGYVKPKSSSPGAPQEQKSAIEKGGAH